MYVAVIKHPVKDYTTWREVYDSFEPRKAIATDRDTVIQSLEDPNNVTVIMHFENLDKANGFLDSAELKAGMQESGVIGIPLVTIGKVD